MQPRESREESQRDTKSGTTCTIVEWEFAFDQWQWASVPPPSAHSDLKIVQVRIQKHPPACHCTPACVRRGRALKINDLPNLPRSRNPCISKPVESCRSDVLKALHTAIAEALHPPCSLTSGSHKIGSSCSLKTRGLDTHKRLSKKKKKKSMKIQWKSWKCIENTSTNWLQPRANASKTLQNHFNPSRNNPGVATHVHYTQCRIFK